MLFLLFQLSEDRYALEVGQIVEVLPLVDLKRIPMAPLGVAGIFNYRGILVPAIDLSALALGRPAAAKLSTRIVIVHYPAGGGEKRLLGLIAEQATETVRREPTDFVSSGVTNRAAPYLGPVAKSPKGLVQWIEVNKLLPASVRELLFKTHGES